MAAFAWPCCPIFIPMYKSLQVCIISLVFTFVVKAQPVVSAGSVVRVKDFPSQYVLPRNVDVWLPPGYNASQKYPVLYMHDGQMLFDSTATWNKQEWQVDEVMGSLIRKGQVPATIVVGIWNIPEYRHADYFPAQPLRALPAALQDSITLRELKGQVRSDQYLRFTVNELKPYIDSAFSTLIDRAHTFIAGSSMGGLISLYAICEYPKVFGGAACLSTHWIGSLLYSDPAIPAAFNEYLRTHLPSPATHRIYFDYGTATLDSLYPPHQQRVDITMRRKGFTAKNWQTQKFPGAAHTEKAWAARLTIPFRFLLKK